MEAFVWDQRFVTGIDIVDEQHQRLVAIVNEVGDLLLSGDQVSEGRLQIIFKQLADYARRHFADEEGLMRDANLDPRHIDAHTRHHHQFVEQVASMWRARGSMKNPAEVVHGFLTAWLTFHILGEDQAMARQLALVRTGDSPQVAYDVEHQPADNSASALLGALHKLYHVLTVQNQDLAESNIRLEEKVAERTRELSEANNRLAAEQHELTDLLKKVEEAQHQLLQSEKMAAIGQLAAGVAHEINNPIGFVNSNLGTLQSYTERLLRVISVYEQCEAKASDVPKEELAAAKAEADLEFLREDIVALLQESQDGLARVKKIVQDLKEFSHVDEAEWQQADLNMGMESTLNVVWNELKYKAEVVREYEQLPAVRCIPAQINQVFMNLLVNAAQAIDGQGTITVRSGTEGRQAWIEVQDTGKGMTPEAQKRIFEPFYTTKPVGKGTGLGLSLSYDIVVKRHAGYFDVTSAPGQGSTFRVWLPIAGPVVASDS
ncbi:MAG TPA: hemerythrin domain-containing protein [Rhodocyclaceae bacterium]|nr:hemerythrin domain-containing protein [Rhodocyclaceae bacterium]